MHRWLLVSLIVMLALAALAGAQSAPVVAQESTPATADTAITAEPVFSWIVPAGALPTGDVQAVFYRVTLAPGASLPLLVGPFCPCSSPMVLPGIGIEVVEEGAYSIRLDAPLTVVRAGMEEPIAAGTATTLGPGGVARFPDYAASGELRNAGDDAASVLGLAILSQEETATPVPALPRGVVASELSRVTPSDWRKLPPGPLTVTLRRLSLPAGAALAPYEPAGLEAIQVEEGEISLAFIPAGEDEQSRPLVFRAGRAVPFLGVSLRTRRVVSNEGDAPASLLVLTISPAGKEAGTPPPA